MARAKEKNGVLVSATAGTGWREKHRKIARNFAKLADGDGRPPPGKNPACDPRPADHADRLGRFEADAAANAPEKEPIACWGGCGAELPNGYRPRAPANGWHARDITVEGNRDVEAYCPGCYKRHGFMDSNTCDEGGEMPRAGREAVLEDRRTACYERLTDDHAVVECADCSKVLLGDSHAAEHARDPKGLPPLAAGTITLRGRTLRFCAVCIGTRVEKLKEDR